MSFRFYQSNWILELGRYGIITTAARIKPPGVIKGEVFVFAIDTEHFFRGMYGSIAENTAKALIGMRNPCTSMCLDMPKA
jgi:hypothetical protein